MHKKITIIERNVLNNEIQVDINRIKNFETTYIDANIPIYPINVGVGPFIMAYNEFLDNFTQSRNLLSVDKQEQSERKLKKMFKQYMVCYHNIYGFEIYMEDWMVNYSNLLNEGYKAGMEYFGKYLSKYSVFDIISSPRYWKNIILKTAFHFLSPLLKKFHS